MNPNHLLTIFLFIVGTTLLSLEVGWLVKKAALPLKPVMAYSEIQLQFIKIWVNVALLIGVILPSVMLIVFWRQPIRSQFFICYLIVVFVQLASEIVFSSWLCKSVVVIIGTLYTGFRIWQLWSGLHATTYSQPWLSLLWLVLIFWVMNIIMLLTMAFPSIFPESSKKL
ncbi:hypothetical protein BJP34_07835 [Moorena producens PAL-8-15-08-1]|uniref:Uncharacterized protein n=1 Tax=Moorena producens PAL-8-15-08-1 TaxID=1458985 RepID=A0A1D8U2Q7_9CYAN|nr:hypothetical protein BJP34_07835 [Moorena producens PAL-8-15-08-1]